MAGSAATDFRLYVISDRSLVDDVPAHFAQCARDGVAFQIREKDLDDVALRVFTRRVVDAVNEPVFVNSSVRVAQELKIGIHLPADAEVPEIRPVARSTHTIAEVERAAADGVDFVVFGPVYETPSKAAFGPPRGLSELRRAVGAAGSMPVFAIGGIGIDRVAEVREHGAHGIAVVRAVMTAADPSAAVQQLLDAL